MRVARCRFRASRNEWAFATRERAAIDAHWSVRQRASPALFNGTIYVLAAGEIKGSTFEGELMPVEFKSFLYWKDCGYPDAGIRDCFGSAILTTADGKVVVARQRSGNLNAGLWYLPGGFIDGRDVDADGEIDIEGSVAREAAEETGFTVAEMVREPGAILTFSGPMVSVGIVYRLGIDGAAALARMRNHIAGDPDSELDDVLTASHREDIAGLAMPGHARVLLPELLPPGEKSVP